MIRSAGIGSGLDVNAIITQIMNAASFPLSKMQGQQKDLTSGISSFGQIKNAFNDLSNSIKNLQAGAQQNYYLANVSDPTVLSATTNNSEVSLGLHTVSVTQLASASKIASNEFADTTTSIGATGTLNVNVGSNSFQIIIDNTNNSLQGIENAINNNINNTGVRASIMQVGSSSSPKSLLVLTSNETGLTNTVSLSDASGNVASTLNLVNTINPAKDAIFNVDGYDISRSSNVVTDVIQGVSLNLNKTTSSPITLQISSDTATVTSKAQAAISDFVSKYNNVIGFLDNGDASNTQSDSTFHLLKVQLQNAILAPATSSSNLSRLADLGISIAPAARLQTLTGIQYVSTGSLTIDANKLTGVINTNLSDIYKVLNNSTDGFLTRIQNAATQITQLGGTIDSHTQSLDKQNTALENRILAEQGRLKSMQSNLQNQYAALDALISQMKSTQDYLTQQLDSTNSNSKNNK
jgi:flagellar hook-associated protein 2